MQIKSPGTGQSRGGPLTSGRETAVLGLDLVVICAVHVNKLQRSICNLNSALIQLSKSIISWDLALAFLLLL